MCVSVSDARCHTLFFCSSTPHTDTHRNKVNEWRKKKKKTNGEKLRTGRRTAIALWTHCLNVVADGFFFLSSLVRPFIAISLSIKCRNLRVRFIFVRLDRIENIACVCVCVAVHVSSGFEEFFDFDFINAARRRQRAFVVNSSKPRSLSPSLYAIYVFLAMTFQLQCK